MRKLEVYIDGNDQKPRSDKVSSGTNRKDQTTTADTTHARELGMLLLLAGACLLVINRKKAA